MSDTHSHSDYARRRDARLRATFREEELASLRFLAWLRSGTLAVVALWLITFTRTPHLIEHVISCALFAALGWVYYALSRRHHSQPWYGILFPVIDALVLIDNLVPIMPWNAPSLPLPVLLRFGSFSFLFVTLTLTAFLYSPWRALWNAVAVGVAWSGAVLYILNQPGAFSETNPRLLMHEDPRRFLATILNPNFVDVTGFQNDLFLLFLVGSLLSIVAWRARALLRRQIMIESNRARLARYFSPNLVDELQMVEAPLDEVRSQQIAVLFADIVGFTRMSERLPPERVIELLRSFQRRMARTVFAHDGTLDKYIGDALMATFGTPHAGKHDALNAIRCARAMIEELDRWNEKRAARGAAPIHVGIGVHFGSVVLGDIGDERRLEFAVIGDTVNVASRIERLTRVIQTDVLVSQDLVDAARREAPEQTSTALAGFVEDRPRKLRGRREPIMLWSFRRVTAQGESAVA
jgi:adenylate cyclase